MIDDPSEVLQPHASLIVVYTSGMLWDKKSGKKYGQQKISIDFFMLSFMNLKIDLTLKLYNEHFWLAMVEVPCCGWHFLMCFYWWQDTVVLSLKSLALETESLGSNCNHQEVFFLLASSYSSSFSLSFSPHCVHTHSHNACWHML